MSDWKERLLQEQDELCERLGRLSAFLDSDGFHELDEEDQELLRQQSAYMTYYARILRDRVFRMKAKAGADAGDDTDAIALHRRRRRDYWLPLSKAELDKPGADS